MISLVTYSYNDHGFVHKMLNGIEKLRPFVTEVVVVDDGSSEPFASFSPSAPVDIRVIRHEINLGPAAAKRTGLGAARNHYLMSVDCDIDFSRAWMLSALSHMKDTSVGLVGAKILNKDFGDQLSRSLYYESLAERIEDPVLFAKGGLWFTKASIYHSLGGLAGFNQKTHEDWYFSQLVTSSGLRIAIDGSLPVMHLRRMRIKSYICRECQYLKIGYKRIIENQHPSVFLSVISKEISDAVVMAREFGCPLLVYVRLAKIVRVFVSIYIEWGGPAVASRFARSIDCVFCGYESVASSLKLDCDLTMAGADSSDMDGAFSAILSYAVELIDPSILQDIAQIELAKNSEFEASCEYDFHYIDG